MVLTVHRLFRARVLTSKGTTRHFLGFGEGAQEVEELPFRVTISEENGQLFLRREDSAGETLAKTWHESVEDAKDAANYEYDLGLWEVL